MTQSKNVLCSGETYDVQVFIDNSKVPKPIETLEFKLELISNFKKVKNSLFTS
jgi:hypothetical protein